MSQKVMNDNLPIRIVHNLSCRFYGTSNLNAISHKKLGVIFDVMKATRDETQSKNQWERRATALLRQWQIEAQQ